MNRQIFSNKLLFFGAITIGLYATMNSAFLQKRLATLGFRAFSSTHGIKSISATDFGKLVNNAEKRKTIQIVDVREPTELAVAKLPFDDVLNLPISRASAWTKEVVDGKTLDKNKPTYCICHHGSRSYSVADFLGNFIYSPFHIWLIILLFHSEPSTLH